MATHHPSAALSPLPRSEVSPEEFRGVLHEYPNVVLHLAGHRHRNRVTDQGGYLEIETCSTLDLPQEGRLIEIWQDSTDRSVIVTYEMFSHLDDNLPILGDDPLQLLRREFHHGRKSTIHSAYDAIPVECAHPDRCILPHMPEFRL